MKLVIVESPAKAKSIQKYLGKGYTVKASKGHVVDLPKSGLGVDPDKDFATEYVVTKPAVLKELQQAARKADTLILAVDPDREGEAIGWHIARELKLITSSGRKTTAKTGLQRIVFTEITKEAVQAAAANPRAIDMNLVNAQQARRVLDRLVGYKLSPLLWKKIRYGLSAGRVQSVAVRLIVEREREREAFKPDEYWDLKADVAAKKVDPLIEYKLSTKLEETDADAEEAAEKVELAFKLTGEVDSKKKLELTKQSQLKDIVNDVKDIPWLVGDVEKREQKKYPSPPFSTSTMQQVSAGKLKFSATRTMKTAQQLYEAGHITYMRTDSVHISGQAINAARKFIEQDLGANFIPDKPIFYKTKQKVAQEAHEAVRPTDFSKSAAKLGLDGDQARLYDLIRSRALSSQMKPAVLELSNIKLTAGKYLFQATAKKVKFPGYLKVYSDSLGESDLPDVKPGEKVYPKHLLAAQHFTEPPPRFSEASLIKELEKLGIGRPSTYAPTLQTIQTRQYVEKLGNYFVPTDTGRVVTDLLVEHFGDIVDVGFTAEMENHLDEIANGELDWVKMLGDFYKPFTLNIDKQTDKIARADYTVLGEAPADIKCPVCEGKMIIKLGKFGRFYSCTKFPDCKGMRSMTGESDADIAAKVKDKDFTDNYLPAPKTDDDRDFLLKQGRFGEFWAHPDYPKVKDARPLELQPHKVEELYGKPPLTDDQRPYLLKSGRFGKFWAHPDYPAVKDVVRIKGQKSSFRGRGSSKKGKGKAKPKAKGKK